MKSAFVMGQVAVLVAISLYCILDQYQTVERFKALTAAETMKEVAFMNLKAASKPEPQPKVVEVSGPPIRMTSGSRSANVGGVYVPDEQLPMVFRLLNKTNSMIVVEHDAEVSKDRRLDIQAKLVASGIKHRIEGSTDLPPLPGTRAAAEKIAASKK